MHFYHLCTRIYNNFMCTHTIIINVRILLNKIQSLSTFKKTFSCTIVYVVVSQSSSSSLTTNNILFLSMKLKKNNIIIHLMTLLYLPTTQVDYTITRIYIGLFIETNYLIIEIKNHLFHIQNSHKYYYCFVVKIKKINKQVRANNLKCVTSFINIYNNYKCFRHV